ncbi:hypothetical protein SAMN04487829_1279 [Pseudobutyrivibrio sp. NOR37]|uniref:Uncharacterized protein n=1 Tax=Pseudobutyrivibrio xylanivorans TaxID=185007 RepID=A0A6M0LGK7_PSEXY|nr:MULTISPECIES: hypothetical protein [Pseudobutyrivibrio]NEX01674.1 hypothetical protein [Pseudobutyrivibrio xylanivorans]SFR70891.1 hypothetical protein SAMN04487829_1279 [Pseudobutyrivibrio sp. NOR37]
MNKYSKEWFIKYIDDFEHLYFQEIKDISVDGQKVIKNLGIKANNNVSREYEENIIEKEYLDKGIVNDIVVAWKAGRLEKKGDDYIIQMKDGNYLNGYGRPIKASELNEYLNRIQTKDDDSTNEEDFEKEYKKYIEEAGHVPNNFGAVYIINLMYFKSSRKWPIYDKFAHKALKAILMEKSPGEIWIGDAPLKGEQAKVTNMYLEYCWLITTLFGGKEIERKIDRALWVYGHATEK